MPCRARDHARRNDRRGMACEDKMSSEHGDTPSVFSSHANVLLTFLLGKAAVESETTKVDRSRETTQASSKANVMEPRLGGSAAYIPGRTDLRSRSSGAR